MQFTHANPKAQKYIMGAFEQLIKQNQEALLPKTAHILKAFYDTDILDEEIIIKWGEKVTYHVLPHIYIFFIILRYTLILLLLSNVNQSCILTLFYLF